MRPEGGVRPAICNSAAASLSSISYQPHGGLASETLGNSLIHQMSYNTRLQTTAIKLGTSGNPTSVLNLTYDYGTTDNNANVKSHVNTIGSLVITDTISYDSLNRISATVETSTAGGGWTETNGYDRYGNRWIDLGGGNQNLTFSTSTNRITTSGHTYDSAGNLTNDTIHAYTFDAENKIKTVDINTAYTYDGEGQRVRKVVYQGENTRFIYGISGQLLAEFSGSTGNLTKEYIQAGGTLITIEPTAVNSNGTRYTTSDHLGSPRVVTNSSAGVLSRHDYLPFGEELFAGTGGRTTAQGYSASDGIRQKFTGYEADGETGLNFAQARYQSPAQGRFTSVDPTLKSIDPENPQTLNRYTYALNNPLAYVDPDGEDSVKIGTWDDLSSEQKRLFETYVQKNYADQLGKTTVTDFAKTLFNNSADLANGITTGDGKGLLSQSQLTSFIGITHMLESKNVINQVASISEIHGDEAKDHTYRIIGDLVNNSSAVKAIKKAFPWPIGGKGHGQYSESNREQGPIGAPNGQVSRVPKGTGVDVDVDYRCILCKGHVSKGGVGSDIRVGTHYEDHVKRYGPIPALSRIKD